MYLGVKMNLHTVGMAIVGTFVLAALPPLVAGCFWGVDDASANDTTTTEVASEEGEVTADISPDVPEVGAEVCVPECGGLECGPDPQCGESCGECGAKDCQEGQCLAQPCEPDCAGRECGDDRCEGSCGDCAEGFLCDASQCVEEPCVPKCHGGAKKCGNDGCGGNCGECDEGSVCEAFKCVEIPCEPDCTDKECGDDGCGGSCGECAEGEECEDGACAEGPCEPDCSGNECGDDGCGGSCGQCPGFQEECVDGACCAPDCGVKVCGDDGCGGSCGQCADGMGCAPDGQCVPSVWTDPTSGLWWQNPPAELSVVWDLANSYCKNLILGGYDDWQIPTIGGLRSLVRGCPGTEFDGTCNIKEGDCLSSSSWADASCSGCAVGNGPANGCYWPDAMQGTCGPYWSTNFKYNDDPPYDPWVSWVLRFTVGGVHSKLSDSPGEDVFVRCVRCTPGTCDGKECGPDGCGGSCGNCTGPQEACSNRLCVCQPACDYKACGDDGCGGSCGSCAGGKVCQLGQCVGNSGLMWQDPPAEDPMDLPDAFDYCNALVWAGHADWRVPSFVELKSLLQGCPGFDGTCPEGEGPANGCYWPPEMQGECLSSLVNPDEKWSWWWSTEVDDGPDCSWLDPSHYWPEASVLNFGNGAIDTLHAEWDWASVRCAR